MLFVKRMALFFFMLVYYCTAMLLLLTDAWVVVPSFSIKKCAIISSSSRRSTGAAGRGAGGTMPLQCTQSSEQTKSIIVIQQLARTDIKELERMSKFCIDTFYNQNEDEVEKSIISRKWRDIQLAVLQKAQLLEISLFSDQYFRFIFVAKVFAADGSGEIIGCCEIIEERINSSQRSSTKSERERRQTARHRPIIENLCVKEGYRECGVGMALIQACENAVVQLSRGYCDEVFTQVESGNVKAYNLFRKCGYQDHVTDPTCTIVALDKSPFARETTVTKLMMRKIMSY